MSIVTNMQIIINDIKFKNNGITEGSYTINPRFTRKTGSTGDGKFYTELTVSMLDTENSKFPFDIYVSITGIFDIKDHQDDYIKNFLNINAIQILFPYIRSIVTSLTTTAMVPPVVLPIINPNTLFSDKNDNN